MRYFQVLWRPRYFRPLTPQAVPIRSQMKTGQIHALNSCRSVQAFLHLFLPNQVKSLQSLWSLVTHGISEHGLTFYDKNTGRQISILFGPEEGTLLLLPEKFYLIYCTRFGCP